MFFFLGNYSDFSLSDASVDQRLNESMEKQIEAYDDYVTKATALLDASASAVGAVRVVGLSKLVKEAEAGERVGERPERSSMSGTGIDIKEEVCGVVFNIQNRSIVLLTLHRTTCQPGRRRSGEVDVS